MKFAKYLPIEGDVKNNKLAFDTVNDYHRIQLFTASIREGILYDERGFVRKIENCKPVKLFLCSRDIQVGDEYFWSQNPYEKRVAAKVENGYVDTGNNATSTHTPITNGNFKIIGEISPEAKWVKEGDEFDEEELIYAISYDSPFEGWVFVPLSTFLTKTEDVWLKRIQIKGPCGHFH